jgi:hypothetical protein
VIHVAWREDANCLDMDPEMFFDKASEAAALAACVDCPVRTDCREETDKVERLMRFTFGVYGGETARQRRARRRKDQREATKLTLPTMIVVGDHGREAVAVAG